MACRMRAKSSPSGNLVDGTGKYFAQLSPGLGCGIMGEKAKELSMMLFAKKKMRYVTLGDFELRLAKAALIQFRNALIAKGLPTEDVNGLLLKLYK